MNINIGGTPSISLRRNKYNTIQVFRFFAALLVVILHSTFYTAERLKPGFNLYYQGGNGVRLFFAISGFVMIISSENLIEHVRGWKIFAVKRMIRIIPIYWIITSVKLFVLIFASSAILHAQLDYSYILKSYLFLPATNADGELFPFLGVGWTLNIEMFFYLMFTIALALKVKPINFLSLIFIPLSVLSFFKSGEWPAIRFYADPIVLDFLYGMVAARLVLNGKMLPQKWAIPIIITGLVYLFLPNLETIPGLYKFESITLGVASFFVVLGGASVEKKFGSYVPNWLVYLGGASYSLYLIHPLIAPIAPALLHVLDLQWPWISVILSVIISVIAGTLFYKYCERPFSQFLSKKFQK